MSDNAIPSKEEVTAKLADTGLLTRAIKTMKGTPNYHPSGLAQWQVQLGLARPEELAKVKEAIEASGEWTTRMVNVAGGQRELLILENDVDTLTAWEEAKRIEDEKRDGIRKQLKELTARYSEAAAALADVSRAMAKAIEAARTLATPPAS